MCNGVACWHGECVTQRIGTSTVEACACKELYSGTQCGFRSGLLYVELPLAAVLLFVVAIMGWRITDIARTLLCFPESKRDFFAFPRQFERTARRLGILQPYIGRWIGPTQKTIPLGRHFATKAITVVVVALELLTYVQVAAIPFLPIVPWPVRSKLTSGFLRLFLLHPMWSHLQAHAFPHLIFYLAAAFVPANLILACILGLKRFPLFKPQPTAGPTEDLCTLALRMFSEWAILPVMIALFLPFECLFVGYLRQGSLIMIPSYDPVCFSWVQAGQVALGLTMVAGYWLVSSGVVIQLNCEASPPQPTLWTDVRYVRILHALRGPLALSVVAFSNSNPQMLCLCSMLASICLLVVNAWMWPSLYSLANWLRLYGAILSTWSGAIGLVASIRDNPSEKVTYEIWSLGSIALSAVTFSALLMHYTEEFWFQLSILGGKPRMKLAIPQARAGIQREEDSSDGIQPSLMRRLRPNLTMPTAFKAKLVPSHVSRKRSRRNINRIEDAKQT